MACRAKLSVEGRRELREKSPSVFRFDLFVAEWKLRMVARAIAACSLLYMLIPKMMRGSFSNTSKNRMRRGSSGTECVDDQSGQVLHSEPKRRLKIAVR